MTYPLGMVDWYFMYMITTVYVCLQFLISQIKKVFMLLLRI